MLLQRMKVYHNENRNQRASEILTRVLVQSKGPRLNEEDAEYIACMETSLRADVVDEWAVMLRSLWCTFRIDLDQVFHRETGVRLPLCCRLPRSNLYRALRETHQDRKA